jgi:hypothetical protein
MSLSSHFGQASAIHIGQCQVAAFFSQLQSQSSANSPSSSGDNRHAILQIDFAYASHLRSSLWGIDWRVEEFRNTAQLMATTAGESIARKGCTEDDSIRIIVLTL